MAIALMALPCTVWADYAVREETRQVRISSNTTPPKTFIDPAGVKRILPVEPAKYVLLSHYQTGPQGNTLLICLHGAGDNAANFANLWVPLMRQHPNLAVAAVEINMFAFGRDQIAAIVADTVAKDHVNPKHVILVGHSLGSCQAQPIVEQLPGLFAGYASLSGSGLQFFLTPALRPYGDKLALYENDGTGEGMSQQRLAFDAAVLRYYGFSHVRAEASVRGHNLNYVTFQPDIESMMAFFDESLATMDKKLVRPLNQPATPSPPANIVVERRKPANATAGYVFLTPDRSKVPSPRNLTLLICLHGPGDTGADFAKNWYELVNSRSDVVVAVPNNGAMPEASYASFVQAIIDDTEARDHVNFRHIVLIGHDLGGAAAANIVGSHPELFDGYAGISTGLFPKQFGWELQKFWQKIPVYYAVGAHDEMFGEVYPANVAQLREAGFAHLLTEAPPAGHELTQEEIKHLMAFFDEVFAQQEKSAAVVDGAAK